MLKNLLFCFLLFASYSLFAVQSTEEPIKNSNKVKRYLYKDKIVALERWYGDDKKVDSVKTYYKTGVLNEKFYYLKGKYHGNSYKYNRNGEKSTTWLFDNGKLVKRTDHILNFNKKDEEKVKNLHEQLSILNQKIKETPNSFKLQYSRASIRYKLGNHVLALRDFHNMSHYIKRIAKKKNVAPPAKILGNIYDISGSIYHGYEMENYATHYKFKATEAAPDDTRLTYNLGSYLYTIKSYRLSQLYLNKALEKWPNHAFTHRVLAAMYTDFEDYEKAKQYIDIAFPKEKNLLKFGFGKVERDIRTLRGFISHKLGNSNEGIADLEEAINLHKDNSFAYRNLGVVHHDLGNHILACEYLKKAQTLGYEKIHDRGDDLKNYLEFSCNINNQITAKASSKKEAIKTVNPLNKPYVFPNPATDVISIKNITFSNYGYAIYNFESKLMKQDVTQTNSINLADLSTGLYILNIFNKGNEYNFKVVKK